MPRITFILIRKKFENSGDGRDTQFPNFDNRSFRLNFEVTSVIVNEEFAQQMEAMFEADFAHAEPIDPESLEERSLWWRIGVKLSRLAAPVL